MKPLTNAITTLFRDTKPGDLIQVGVRGTSVFAIVLDKEEKDDTVVGFLQSFETKPPYLSHSRYKAHIPCISYGPDWFMQPIFSDVSFAGNDDLRSAYACLHLSGPDYYIQFHPLGNDYFNHTDIWFNLTQSKIADRLPNNAAPILEWNIWENDGAHLASNAEPLLPVIATAVQPGS
jgi:hypothetical protein